jgi:hypothetical protein
MTKMNKKTKFIALFLVLGLLGTVLFWLGRRGKRATEDKTPALPTPATSIFDKYSKPKIEVEIFASKDKGRLLLSQIPEIFKKVEYDVIYQTAFEGGLLEKGITSGKPIDIPSNGTLTKKLVFGTESCTPQRCNFHKDRLELDYPITVVLRLYDDQERVWEIEKEIKLEKVDGVFQGSSE